MAYKCFAGREVLATLLGLGVLSVFLVPHLTLSSDCGPHTACPSHLRQLYVIGIVYASTHKDKWPDAIGSALWRSFAEMKPPLIDPTDLDVLTCPAKRDGGSGRCDYLGPRKPVSELGPGDPLGGERPGSHGPGEPGRILLKDGTVVEAQEGDPRWASLQD
jgi:hypothetical protein